MSTVTGSHVYVICLSVLDDDRSRASRSNDCSGNLCGFRVYSCGCWSWLGAFSDRPSDHNCAGKEVAHPSTPPVQQDRNNAHQVRGWHIVHNPHDVPDSTCLGTSRSNSLSYSDPSQLLANSEALNGRLEDQEVGEVGCVCEEQVDQVSRNP